MKKQSRLCFVVQIVGASLALAGIICLLIARWDRVTACLHSFFTRCADIFSCPDLDEYDYADEQLFG